jgi:hypothetical protein
VDQDDLSQSAQRLLIFIAVDPAKTFGEGKMVENNEP